MLWPLTVVLVANTNGRLAIPALAGLLVKIIIIDDVTFWSKFEYMIIGNNVYWILLILFHN